MDLPPSPSPSPIRRDLRLVLLVLALQFAALAWTFPLGELLSDAPLFHVDSSFHWYQMRAAEAFWRDGRLVGYDPWFAAGHLGGVSYNASAKLPALLGVLLSPWLDAAVVYKLYAFFSALLAPACVVLAMRWLRADTIATVAATMFGFLLWWISAFRWYHTSAMVSFVFASYAALPYIALVWRSLSEPLRTRRVLLLGALGALGLFYHPLFPLPVLFCAPMLIAFRWTEVRWRQAVAVVVGVPVLAMLPNLLWVLPSLHYPGWSSNGMTPYQKEVDIGIAWNEMLGRIKGHARGARLNPLLWFLSAWGVCAGATSSSARLAAAFVCSAAALIVFAAVGAAVPLFATLTPNRLSTAGYLLLVVPAGLGVSATVRIVRDGVAWPHLAAGGSAAVLGLALLFHARELGQEWSRAPGPHYGATPPEVRGIGPHSRWILDWLAAHTSADARVLFETSGGRIHDGAHMAGFLALRSQREFVGGPYVFMHHAGFWDGNLFGRRIGDWSAGELDERLRLYNVGWAIVHSEASKRALDAHPGFTRQAQRDPFAIYAWNQPQSYFIEGEGRVVGRDFDAIRLAGVHGGAVTLKYHYAPGLFTVPAARLEPVHLPGDPQPFVRIVNPPESLTLRWR